MYDLRYFKCKALHELIEAKNMSSINFICSDPLESFQLGSYDEASKQLLFLLAKKFKQMKKPIPMLVNPSSELMTKKTFKSFGDCGIKRLEYFFNAQGNPYSIPEPIAKYLEDLFIIHSPNADWLIKSPLNKLKYLEIKNFQAAFSESMFTNLLLSSPYMKSLKYGGDLTFKLLQKLLQHFSSLQALELVDIDCYIDEEGSDKIFAFDLPRKIRVLSISTNTSYSIFDCFSSKLTILRIDKLINFDFNLPNLKVLASGKTKLELLRLKLSAQTWQFFAR